MLTNRIGKRRLVVGMILGPAAVFWMVCTSSAAKPKPKPFPTFARFEKVILRYCQDLPDYQPGGIVVRSEVEPIFKQLKMMGWVVAERRSILNRVPADNDFLVRKLRTRKGKEFMGRIANCRQAYDRLDRLCWLPHGKQTVHDLIHGKDGYKLLEYLTNAPGGKELGKMLSKAPKGADFNKPTGKVYTIRMLLVELKKSHQAAKQAAAAGK